MRRTSWLLRTLGALGCRTRVVRVAQLWLADRLLAAEPPTSATPFYSSFRMDRDEVAAGDRRWTVSISTCRAAGPRFGPRWPLRCRSIPGRHRPRR